MFMGDKKLVCYQLDRKSSEGFSRSQLDLESTLLLQKSQILYYDIQTGSLLIRHMK